MYYEIAPIYVLRALSHSQMNIDPVNYLYPLPAFQGDAELRLVVEYHFPDTRMQKQGRDKLANEKLQFLKHSFHKVRHRLLTHIQPKLEQSKHD